MTVRAKLLIKGHVQGIGYRWFVMEAAQRMGLSGWVRNLPSGEVEAEAQGDAKALAGFVRELKQGHPYARVGDIVETKLPARPEERSFDIVH